MKSAIYVCMALLVLTPAGCSREQSPGVPRPGAVPAAPSPDAPTPHAATPSAEAAAPSEETASAAPAVNPGPARTELLTAGEAAPDFAAKDHTGKQLRLGELLATQQVVLIFYPADFTPGCTKQLCAVRDEWSEFRRRGATVLGVNPADVEKHASFAEKYEFPFPVISDEGGHIAAAYGCQGKEYTKRAVYAIGRDGKVLLAEAGMVPHEKIFAALDSK